MGLVRPGAAAALARWRAVLAGAAAAGLGLWWVLTSWGLLVWTGWVLVAAGLALALAGVQRARFRTGAGGPGVVVVDEGEITYMGPLTGGSAALAEVDRLVLDRTARPPHWLLERAGAPALAIPVNAEGAEALFDAFAALPGLRTERMLAELGNRGPHPVVIWARRGAPPARERLH